MLSLKSGILFFIQKCKGSFFQKGPCENQPPCPAPVVVWGSWEPYSRCTTTCGVGYSMRCVFASTLCVSRGSVCQTIKLRPKTVYWWS